MKREIASVLMVLTAFCLVACGNQADSPAAASSTGPTQRQAMATAATSGAKVGDNATLKGATALWSQASAQLAQPEVLKPATHIAAAPEQRVTPVVHHIVHPSLAARVANRNAPTALSRPGDMAGARSVEVRSGDKIGMRPGDEIN